MNRSLTRGDKPKLGKFDFATLLFCTLFFGLLLTIVAYPLRLSTLQSIGVNTLMISFYVLVLFYFLCSFKKGINIKTIFVFLYCIVTLFFAISFSPSFDYFSFNLSRYLCFLMFPCMFIILGNDISKFTYKTVYIFNLLVFAYFCVLFLSPYSHLYVNEYGYQNISDLTLGFDNPNQTAMLLLINLFIFVIFSKDRNKIDFFSLASYVCALVVFVMIALTKCRVGIVISLLFLVLGFTSLHRFVIKKPFILLILLSPFIYIAASFALNINVLSDSLDNGRVFIYRKVFENLDPFKFFFGDYITFAYDNLHNAYLTIFASFGVVVFLLFFTLLCYFCNFMLINLNKNNLAQVYAFFAFLLIIAHGSVETAFITSGSLYGGLVLVLIVLFAGSGANNKRILDIGCEISI